MSDEDEMRTPNKITRPRRITTGRMLSLACGVIFSSTFAALGASSALAVGPPLITKTSFHVAGNSVQLEAMVDPNGRNTTYHFQYVDQADFKASGFAGATSAPVPDAEIPAEIAGSGDLTAGSATVKNVTTTAGAFAVGQPIEGAGIPASATIKAVAVVAGATTLTLSSAATATAQLVSLTAKGPQPVSTTIGPLPAATTYHFRLIAHNAKQAKEENTVGPEVLFTTPIPSPVFGSCPNDPFRIGELAPLDHPSAALPDCRAYEQASPVNKNGSEAAGDTGFVRAALAGGAVTYLSTTGIPGGEGSQEIPLYRALREGGEWRTRGLLPPAEAGQLARVIGWLPDLSTAYVQAGKFGSPLTTALFARPAAGGPLAQIAPYTNQPEYAFAGATPDGSEVLFESPRQLPTVEENALVGKPNLYVWDRATKTLRLAGVMNDHEAPPAGAFGGPYDWARGTDAKSLSGGGSSLFYYTQDEHAVATGGAVFFTAAGTGQIYKRINPTAPQSNVVINGAGEEECTEPAKACTINISATEKKNGKGPGGSDAAGARPAAFMAATPDGSKAFFTSSEKLTDDANTGPEPELPAIARSNLEGNGKDLSFIPAHAQGIAIGGEYVYWANPDAGTIGRAKLDGSETSDESFITPGPVEGAPSRPQWVAVDSEHVYWTNSGELDAFGVGVNGKGTIGRAKLNGEEVEPALVKGANNPLGIAVDAEHVYWANGGNFNESDADKFLGVGRAKLDGSEMIQPWSPGFTANGGVAVDDNTVYFTRAINQFGWIEAVGKANPEFEFQVIVQTEKPGTRLQGLTVSGSHIYWADTGTSTIGRAKLTPFPKVASEVEDEFIKEAGRPVGLAAAGSDLYWAANQNAEPNPGNDLYRYEEGGSLEDITADPADADGAEVLGVLGTAEDGSRAYFAANGVLAANEGAMGTQASPGDCHGPIGEMHGSCNLYVWQEEPGEGEGTVEFIAQLDVNGNHNRTDSLDWAPTSFQLFFTGSYFLKTAAVSADGRVLLFRSQAQLTPSGNQGTPELYRYQVGEPGTISCVSCNPTGEAPTSGPTLSTIGLSESSPIRPASVAVRNLSADGRRVFFESAEALVGADTNGEAGCPTVGSAAQNYPACRDVYEWEAPGAGTCTQGGPAYSPANSGCLYLLSSGKSGQPSFFLDAPASGDDVFIFTRDQLVAQDTDELLDVYDARREGGLTSQNQRLGACGSSESCKPAATPPPAFDAPPHSSGPGNPPPKRCKPGFRVKHNRCVRRHHKQNKPRRSHHRRAGR